MLSVCLDQYTKQLAQSQLMVWSHETEKNLYQGSRRQVFILGDDMPASHELSSYVQGSFNYVRNPGAAWGSFSKMSEKMRMPLFYFLTVAALGLIGYFLYVTPISHKYTHWGLYLVVGGALGNLIDRIRLGFVIDWIDIRWRLGSWRYNFPAFNLADAFITIGVALLAFDLIFPSTDREASTGGGQG